MYSNILRACLTILLLASSALAEVPIKKEHWIYNKTQRQCVYCTLETLGYYHRIEALYGLTDTYKNPAGPNHVKRVLDARGVTYKQYYGNNGLAWAEWCCKHNVGCGIAIKPSHFVTLVELNKEKAIYIENVDLTKRTMTREQFNRIYGGWVVIVWQPQK